MIDLFVTLSNTFMPYMCCFIMIIAAPIFCKIGAGADGMTAESLLVAQWVVIVTSYGTVVSYGIATVTAPLRIWYVTKEYVNSVYLCEYTCYADTLTRDEMADISWTKCLNILSPT